MCGDSDDCEGLGDVLPNDVFNGDTIDDDEDACGS